MKLTFLLLALMLCFALAGKHSFRHHKNNDNNKHDDKSDSKSHNNNSNDNNHKDDNSDSGDSNNSNSNENADNHSYESNESADNHNYESNSNVDGNDNGDNTEVVTTEPVATESVATEPTMTDNSGEDNTEGDNTEEEYTEEEYTEETPIDNTEETITDSNSSSGDPFIDACLKGHNEERASLGIAPVTYNNDLAVDALAWAEKIASSGSLSHSSGRVHIGENVADRTYHDGVDSTPLLIGQWLDEKRYFKNGDYPNISTSGNVHDVGHYSQMIWAKTTEIGCGVARKGRYDYLCCQYKVAGNMQGDPVY